MAGGHFSAASFYSFAQSLQERWPHDEAAVRTTISRAYYGAFIGARDAENLDTRGKGSHKGVIEHYSSLGSPKHSLIARTLSTLRSMREKADYELKVHSSSRDAVIAIQAAKKVMDALELEPAALPLLVPKATPGVVRTDATAPPIA